jgi:hypothetical protein
MSALLVVRIKQGGSGWADEYRFEMTAARRTHVSLYLGNMIVLLDRCLNDDRLHCSADREIGHFGIRL